MYKCINCKKIMEIIEGQIRCAFCGARVFAKIRPTVVNRVRAQ